MFLQKAMKQGRNVYGISSCNACSRICPYNIQGVWSHSMGDMPTPFCVHPTCIIGSKIGLPSAVSGQLCEIKLYIKCCSDN